MTLPEHGSPETRSEPAATGPAAPQPVTERGWRQLLLALAAFLFVIPAVPFLRALVPVTQTLVLLVPAVAACAWVAWYRNGKLWTACAWTLVAAWVLSRPLAGGDAYIAFVRGWALLLGASFGVLSLTLARRAFIARALVSLAICAGITAGVLAVRRVNPVRVERAMSAELADRATSSVASLRSLTSSPEWQERMQGRPERAQAVEAMMDGFESELRAIVPIGTTLFPAILLLESLAALGLAWSLHHRLSRTRIGPPLAPLAAFRFDDHLIWGIIAGLLLVLLPRLAEWQVVGLNILMVLGALYALRGFGIMMWFLVAPGRWLGVMAVSLIAIGGTLVWQLWILPLGIGLSDTYFDWRRRGRSSTTGVPND